MIKKSLKLKRMKNLNKNSNNNSHNSKFNNISNK